jgi:hypothetical protein
LLQEFSEAGGLSRMLFGHNSNVTVGADVVHVQTEDRGTGHAFIDTTVHWHGRILHRRTNNYRDLLPLDEEKEKALKARLDDQHRLVIEEIRTGALKLTFPAPPAAQRKDVPLAPNARPAGPAGLKVELINAKTWLSGKHATLQLMVRDAVGNAAAGAEAKALVEGAEGIAEFSTLTGDDGAAMLQFEMPQLSGAEVALVIEASRNGAKGHLRFLLRAKPRG